MRDTVTVVVPCQVHRPGAGGIRQTIVMQPGPRDKAALVARLGEADYLRLVKEGAIDDPVAEKQAEKQAKKQAKQDE